ncbi:MAG TPA: APC family permease [Candidatus Dormibacteraeota bacterium]|nr:APC family permease [Candidatus Dormibacteraeota bacterium]
METKASSQNTQLVRGLGLGGAIALNVNLMIGVGPFITLPLVVEAMGGPQAMLGWVLGALLALCDGLVIAELGAAMPDAGGSYAYIRDIYGRNKLGRLLSFLFVWQLTFSAPLSIASGCIGLSLYAAYLWPSLLRPVGSLHLSLPLGGALNGNLLITRGTFLAIAVCLLATLLSYRKIGMVGSVSKFLFWGVLGTILWVIFAGFTHFHPSLAFTFPPGAFRFSSGFFLGLGAAMLVTTYDYWGYYNVAFLGGEVRDPGRTIPRAVIYSVVLVAALYLAMTLGVMGVIPWQELMVTAHSNARDFVISSFMQRIYGRTAAAVVTLLILWTAFASIFSLLMGYSRVPYAAALDGNYFRAFKRLHPRHQFPSVSLVTVGVVAAVFCTMQLVSVIAALVVIRLLLQFLVQDVGLIVLRIRRPDLDRPFRMWLYPLPALVAIAGFIYILISRPHFARELRYGFVILLAGLIIYAVRAVRRSEWPFTRGQASAPGPGEP